MEFAQGKDSNNDNEDDDADSVDSGESWNKLTKVEEIITRKSLVCCPPQLGASLVRLVLMLYFLLLIFKYILPVIFILLLL